MIKKLFFTLLCTAVCRTISAQVVDPYVPAPENLRARTEFQEAYVFLRSAQQVRRPTEQLPNFLEYQFFDFSKFAGFTENTV